MESNGQMSQERAGLRVAKDLLMTESHRLAMIFFLKRTKESSRGDRGQISHNIEERSTVTRQVSPEGKGLKHVDWGILGTEVHTF